MCVDVQVEMFLLGIRCALNIKKKKEMYALVLNYKKRRE